MELDLGLRKGFATRELDNVTEERTIVRKATAYFAAQYH